MAGISAATVVVLASAAVAGCNSGSSTIGGTPVFSSTANPIADSGSAPPGSPDAGSPGPGSPAPGSPGPGSPPPAAPASTAPAPPSSAPPQSNGAYPYEPGGVTYTGEEGAVETFSIPAGSYSLNQQASYNPANDPDGSGECLFGGELDYLSGSGGTIPLGDGSVPITAMSPIEGPATVASYAAGNYRLFIYPQTTCSWTFELWP
jgi:hypothetical protein